MTMHSDGEQQVSQAKIDEWIEKLDKQMQTLMGDYADGIPIVSIVVKKAIQASHSHLIEEAQSMIKKSWIENRPDTDKEDLLRTIGWNEAVYQVISLLKRKGV